MINTSVMLILKRGENFVIGCLLAVVSNDLMQNNVGYEEAVYRSLATILRNLNIMVILLPILIKN